MKSTIVLFAGLAIGFTATVAAVIAIGLALLGLGGGLLARQSSSVASVIGYDPSDVVLMAPAVGMIALLLVASGIVVYSRLGWGGDHRTTKRGRAA